MPITDTPPEVAPSIRNEYLEFIHTVRRHVIQSAVETAAFKKWLKQHLTEIKLGA